MIWRHLVTGSRDGEVPFSGTGLTHAGRNEPLAGVFEGNEEGPAAGGGALLVNLGDFTRDGGLRQMTGRGAGSVGEPLTRGGREHVGLARPRHDVQRGALLRDRAAADADDQVLEVVADLGAAVDVAVGAELLDDVHGDRETGRGVLGVLREGGGGGAVVLNDVEVLGP